MKRLCASVALAAMLLGGCTTTQSRIATATDISPSGNAKILLVDPDVQLNLLTASGLQELRADWSQQGHDDLARSLRAALEGKTHPVQPLDPASVQGGKAGQLLRLHGAVGQSIQLYSYATPLPTKKGGFDWTLGEGASALKGETGAQYALFVTARGSYSSGGRVALMLGAAALGVSVPLGGQTVFASLVDLNTGRIVWFNVAVPGPGNDIRTPSGSDLVTASLLKGAPL